MIIYIAACAVGFVVFVIGLLGVIGSFVPVTHTVAMSVEVGSPGPAVWAALDNIDDFPSWCPGVDRVEILPDRNGNRSFRQYQGRNSFVLEETLKQPPTRVVRTIADDKQFFSGEWDHQIKDLGNGRSIVTVNETGSVPSAIPRAIMKMFIGYDFYLKKFGSALQAKLGK